MPDGPRLEAGLRLAARVRALVEVWRGIRPLRAALAEGAISLSGAAALRRALRSGCC